MPYLTRKPRTKPRRATHPARVFGVMLCMRFRCTFACVSVSVGGVAFKDNGLGLLSFLGRKGRRTWQCCSRWAVLRSLRHAEISNVVNSVMACATNSMPGLWYIVGLGAQHSMGRRSSEFAACTLRSAILFRVP